MKIKRNWILALLLVVSLALFAVAVAACGEEEPAPTDTGTAATGLDQAHAQANLDGLENVPPWEPNGPDFDAKEVMAGESMMSIPGTGSDPFYQEINRGMADAAKAVGYDFTMWNNQGQITQYQQGIANGITRGVTLIDMVAGPNPETLGAQIQEAQDADILCVTSHLTGHGVEVPAVDENLTTDYEMAGRLLADWVIVQDPKAHVLVVVSDEILSTEQMRFGISDEFDTYGGPDIEYKFVNVPIPEWGQKVQTVTQSEIVADPDLTYVLAIYDNMLHFVVPAIEATDSADHVKCIGYNATPGVVDLVREGKVEMDVGDMLNWAGWAIADAEMRMIGGIDYEAELKLPFRVFTEDNAEEMGVPADFSEGFGDEWQAGFLKSWGLD